MIIAYIEFISLDRKLFSALGTKSKRNEQKVAKGDIKFYTR